MKAYEYMELAVQGYDTFENYENNKLRDIIAPGYRDSLPSSSIIKGNHIIAYEAEDTIAIYENDKLIKRSEVKTYEDAKQLIKDCGIVILTKPR